MPKNRNPKKKPIDMTTEELAKHLFPPKVLKKAKEIAHQGESEAETDGAESSHK